MAIDFHKTQVQELLMALHGRSEIPLKLQYLGEGADAFQRLMDNPEYDLAQSEFSLIRKTASTIFRKIGNNKVNLVYLGCGTGFKAIPLIKAASKTHTPVNLLLADISHRMLEICVKEIRKKVRTNLLLQTALLDFEAGNFAYLTRPLRKNFYRSNLMFILGNTLGNLTDRTRILINFRESMATNDYLLIGVELAPKNNTEIQNMLRRYGGEGNTAILFNVFKNTGIDREHGHFLVTYNRVKNQVECRFQFDVDAAVKIGSEQVKMRKGQKVLLEISHKFTAAELRKLFKYAGFKIKLFATNKNRTYALVLAQPQEL